MLKTKHLSPIESADACLGGSGDRHSAPRPERSVGAFYAKLLPKMWQKNQRFFNHFFQGHIEKCPRRTNFPGNICVLRQHFENARETVIREKMRNHR